MKIYFDGCAYYTKEALLRMVRNVCQFIVDPTTTYRSNKGLYATKEIKVGEDRFLVFPHEELTDEEIIDLLSSKYGGCIKLAPDFFKLFGFPEDPSFLPVEEIDVKE